MTHEEWQKSLADWQAAQGKAGTSPGGPPQETPARLALFAEPANVSRHATAAKLQSAIAAAENGDTRTLFAYYRDTVLGGSHVQAEVGKRVLAVVSETPSIIPADKTKPEDVEAAECVKQAIEDCENFLPACVHILLGFFWPVTVSQKVFRPANDPALFRTTKVKMQFTLRRIEPVNPTLLCFQQQRNDPNQTAPWEPELRLYHVNEDGSVAWNLDQATPVVQHEHIVHRGHWLQSISRDCFGGPARSIMGWCLLATLGRDWFARGMERYGSPFPVAKTQARDAAAVSFLQGALSLATKIGGLVVDEGTQVELVQAMQGDMAGGYEKFLNVCNRHVSIAIVGQTTSSEAQGGGLGNGDGGDRRQVREDIERFDRATLAGTLREQLFKWILRYNGKTGSAPNIVWGGLSPDAAKAMGALLVDIKNAGLQATDDALSGLGEKIGFEIERVIAPPTPPMGGGFGGVNLTALAASLPAYLPPASDAVARDRAAALARGFRGDLAPVITLLTASDSPEEFERLLANHFRHWKPGRAAAVAEEALQLCAAAGATTRTS